MLTHATRKIRASDIARAGLAVALGVALAGCGKASGHHDERFAPRVLVQEIHFTSSDETRDFVAAIHARVETEQGFRVDGKVSARLVETGQKVTAGQALARLDDADLRLRKEQSEAELAASKTALQQGVAEDQRSARLLARGWTTQAAYDRIHAAAAEANGRNLRAQRAVELAVNSLDYATLRAAADGVVIATFIEPGQIVAPGEPTIRLARSAEKEAAIALPETFVAKVRSGDARLTLWSNPGKSYRAVLRELAPAADPVTRTFAARFSLPDADDMIELGMSATLTVTPRRSVPVARVPLSALIDEGNGSALWVVAPDGSLRLRPIAARRYDSRDVEISSGVAEGDKVVVLGAQKLEVGEMVRPITQLSF